MSTAPASSPHSTLSFRNLTPNFHRETTDWTLKVRVPENLRQWMVPKGSVAIEGISLTIAAVDGETISIAILPLTYWRTNLHTLAIGRAGKYPRPMY